MVLWPLERVKPVWTPRSSINHVVLTEAEEERINTHGIHAEETVSNQVGADHHRLMGKTHRLEPLQQTPSKYLMCLNNVLYIFDMSLYCHVHFIASWNIIHIPVDWWCDVDVVPSMLSPCSIFRSRCVQSDPVAVLIEQHLDYCGGVICIFI